MICPGTDLPSGVLLQEEQFQGIIIEHKQYYNEKSMSCRSRHCIIIVGIAPTAATKLHAVASSAQGA